MHQLDMLYSIAELVRRYGCITPGQVAQILGVKREKATYLVYEFVRRYEVEYFGKINGASVGVVCAPGAVPRAELDALCRLVSKARSRIVHVTYARLRRVALVPPLWPLYAVVLHRVGAEISHVSDGIVATVDVEKVKTLCRSLDTSNGAYEIKPREKPLDMQTEKKTTSRRAGERMIIITVHVPPGWVKHMDELVSRGTYRTRSDVIRAAVKELIMRYLK